MYLYSLAIQDPKCGNLLKTRFSVSIIMHGRSPYIGSHEAGVKHPSLRTGVPIEDRKVKEHTGLKSVIFGLAHRCLR